VEASTHRRLRLLAADDAEALALLARGIELTPGGDEAAQLKFLPNGDCSMLDGAGLCRVQRRFGHEELFEVCATFPRYFNQVDDELELFGTLACPEVARLALLSDDGFETATVTLDAPPRKLRNRFGTEAPYFQPYREVRATLTGLFLGTGLPLTEKLFVLLWLAERLRPVLNAECKVAPGEDLRGVLQALSGAGVLEALANQYRALRIEGELPLSVFWHALPPESSPRAGARRFDELVKRAWAAYGRLAGDPPDLDAARASTLWAEHATLRAAVPGPIRDQIDLCLSRYVVNQLSTTPYMLAGNLFAYSYELVVRVALLRFLLQARLSGFSGEATAVDRVIVEVTYSFVRAVEHTPLLNTVQRLLEAQGLDSFVHALCFLAI
jgi:lysine-N-methylase